MLIVWVTVDLLMLFCNLLVWSIFTLFPSVPFCISFIFSPSLPLSPQSYCSPWNRRRWDDASLSPRRLRGRGLRARLFVHRRFRGEGAQNRKIASKTSRNERQRARIWCGTCWFRNSFVVQVLRLSHVKCENKIFVIFVRYETPTGPFFQPRCDLRLIVEVFAHPIFYFYTFGQSVL